MVNKILVTQIRSSYLELNTLLKKKLLKSKNLPVSKCLTIIKKNVFLHDDITVGENGKLNFQKTSATLNSPLLITERISRSLS